MNRCRRSLIVLVAGCLISHGQQQEPPTFRATTTLVEFTLVALDGKGRPIADLKKEEVSVSEGGNSRQQADFRFEGAGLAGAPPPPLPPGVFSNRPEHNAAGAQRNLTAIVFDTINTAVVLRGENESNYQMSARDAVMRYMQDLPAHTKIAFYRLGTGITVLHDFTEDIDSLRARIANADLNPQGEQIDNKGMGDTPLGDRALSEMNQVVRDRKLEVTLAGLEALGNHLAGMPGRKNLVWITSGLPIRITTDGWPKLYQDALLKTARRLATQGIAIYPVDAKGVMRGLERPRGRGAVLTNRVTQGNVFASLDLMAEVTGGRFSKYTNDPTTGVTLAAADQRGAYSLGFYTGEPDNDWHALKVKVSRPGVKILYQQGYLSVAGGERPLEWPEEEWRSAAAQPLGSTAVRLDAIAEIGGGTLNAALLIAVDDLFFRKDANQQVADIDIGVIEKTPDGTTGISRVQGTIRLPENRKSGGKSDKVRYAHRWEVHPETTEIRLIVRDRLTSRYGAIEMQVKQIPVAKAVPPNAK
jgi:VWFA-related protein